jgi:hypothetical protein
MELIRSRFSSIFLFAIGTLFWFACQESEVKPHKPLTLNMDVPKPIVVGKSKVIPKSIPEIIKSDMKFELSSVAIKKDLSENPIKDAINCNSRVDVVEKAKNEVQTAGGFWGRIESTKDFKDYSPIGVKIDAKFNQLIFGLRHLCDTVKGLELTHVAKELIKESQGRTKEELVEMLLSTGKAKADIEIYLKYVEFAKRSEHRMLEFSSIQESVLWIAMFVDHYGKFFHGKLADKEHLDQAMPDVIAFKDALDRFSVENENIKIAIMEDFQVPYFYVTEM